MDKVNYVYLLVLCINLLCLAFVSAEESITREFCNMEYFNVTCGIGEIVLIRGASYGRMRLGRCATKDLGYVGCAADVSQILDQRCSGRQSCSFFLPDTELHGTRPCPDDTTLYLEATYSCIRVSQNTGLAPRCSDKPILLTAPSGYISSSLTLQWNVGTRRCPWKIQAGEGQKVNFTLYNFNRVLNNPNSNPDVCYKYARIKEAGLPLKDVSICGKEQRESMLYTSMTNEIEIVMVETSVLENSHMSPFLLKYQAMGCPNLPAPSAGQMSRRGDNVTIICDNGNEIYYLTCKGTRWQGQMGNCSTGGKSSLVFETQSDFPYGILIVVAIGVALGVFLGGLLLFVAVIYMKRRNKRYTHRDFHEPDPHLRPRLPFPEHKTAMMINIHSQDSPHWDHVSKSVDSDETLLRDPSCRTCAIPYCQQGVIPLGPPPGERLGNVTGPADMPMSLSEQSRQHVYECPKMS